MRSIISLLFSVWLLAAFLPKEPMQVTGYVYDSQGVPVNGVSVTIKGKNIGTTTDAAGYFSIQVPDASSILVFQSVGFVSHEAKIPAKGELKIKLKDNEQLLQEVVVTASGVTRKKEMTGAVTADQLEGKSAGVNINSNGAPGNGTSIRIRGYASSTHRNGYKQYMPAPVDREGYDRIDENGFKSVQDDPLSTFSIDVDAASYSNVRRFLNQGSLPPAGAVRVEEMINYFQYGYEQPKGEHPFSVYTELGDCPWKPDHKLLLVGLQGKRIETTNLPSSNITFLIDVSGSMSDPNKLPLVKEAMKMLTDQLREKDRVSIVVYAGAAGLVLTPTSGADKTKIKDAIERLEAGGSTAGGAGIQLAYKTAKENFIRDGNNRVVLCTDGDFNVGMSSDDEMVRLIEKEKESGVFLTVLGFGMGNYQDAKMQKLADKGNGNHAYIDQINEAKKVFINEFGGTMFTIAKDVKFQLEFNPSKVQGYRLIGYENRMLNKEDFNNDKKDAGEMGSGHTVTALYEIIPAGVVTDLLKDVDPLKYSAKDNKVKDHSELLTIKLRYKKPDENISKLMVVPVAYHPIALKNTSGQFKLASAVASFGMILSGSNFKGSSDFKMVRNLASSALGNDPGGYRQEFLQLNEKASKLYRNNDLSKLERIEEE
jgi:Ca-activated chloride channel family protein